MKGASHWQVRALPRRQANTVKLRPGVLHLPHLPHLPACFSPPAEVEKVFKNENLSPIHDDINVFSQKCSFLPKNNDGEES